MITSFTFQNGTSTLNLAPTTQREKDLIRIFRDGATAVELKLVAPAKDSPETLVIQAEAPATKKVEAL